MSKETGRPAPFEKWAQQETQMVIDCQASSNSRQQKFLQEAEVLQQTIDDLFRQYKKATTVEEQRRIYRVYKARQEELERKKQVILVYDTISLRLDELLSLLETLADFNKYWYIVYKLPARKFKRLAGNQTKYQMLLALLDELDADFVKQMQRWNIIDKDYEYNREQRANQQKIAETIQAETDRLTGHSQMDEDARMRAEMGDLDVDDDVEVVDLPETAQAENSATLHS